MNKTTLLNRVKQYADETNRTLVSNKLKVSGRYKQVDGFCCVEVILDGGFVYNDRIRLFCEHTGTCIYAITANDDGNVCMLLKEKGMVNDEGKKETQRDA